MVLILFDFIAFDFSQINSMAGILGFILRSFIMYLVALFLLRLGGLRIMGKQNSVDLVILIMLGSVLSAGLMEIPLFMPSILIGISIVAFNRFLMWLSAKHSIINHFFKGKPILLYQDGEFLWDNMAKGAIGINDLTTSLRLQAKLEDFSQIKSAYLEPNGKISFVLK